MSSTTAEYNSQPWRGNCFSFVKYCQKLGYRYFGSLGTGFEAFVVVVPPGMVLGSMIATAPALVSAASSTSSMGGPRISRI